MESTFTLLKVRGIAIGVNWSWLLVFGLVIWSLSEVLFPATYPGFDGTTYLFMAVVAASLLFASVLLHELGHALRAQREGMPIRGITLWLFGGVAHLGGAPPSPAAEFRVAIWGPLISLALALGFLGGAVVGDRLDWPDTVQGVVDYVGRINLLVLAFNLIPALPLDGGRVLRSWLWRRQRSFVAATRSAARAGQVFGAMLVTIGLLGLFGRGSGFGGLWLAFIGWFLIQAARAEANHALIRQALGGLRVRDLMQPLAGAPAEQADRTSTLEADQSAADAVGMLGDTDGGAAVVQGGRQVGVLRSSDVVEAVERGLANPPQEAGVRQAGILVWLVVGSVMAIAGGALYHPPYVVIAPGDAIDVSDEIDIDGVPGDDLNGRYLIATVAVSRRSALRTVWAALGGDKEVVPVDDLYPAGVDPADYGRVQRQVFAESRQLAAAAAAWAAGMDVTVTGSGARVVEIVDGSPADGVLRRDDVIVEVDGDRIDTAIALVDAIRSHPTETKLALVVERDDNRRTLDVTSEGLPDMAGRPGIGILAETRGLEVDLPFEIRFTDRNIGGPSAGLAYALAVTDLLDDDDHAAGRTIAATGTITLDGNVGPVGGVEQKATAVDDAGAELFLVPNREVDEASGDGLTVRGVARLEEALSILRSAL